MRMKDLFGITKLQKETDLKIALEKLEFLASEMEKDHDRKDDLRFWKESLQEVEQLNDGRSFMVKKVYKAYYLLFRVFLRKHDLQND